jgi:hypothetical protein
MGHSLLVVALDPIRTLLLLALALGASSPAAAAQARFARRYAVLIASNDGEKGEQRLRFAESDARRMFDVLTEVGFVNASDAMLVLGKRADAVTAELATFEARLKREAKEGDELLVYASSHADGGDLHLNGTRLPIQRLNQLMKNVPVSVAFLVIDSCRSGAATRVKGLKVSKPVPTMQIRGSHLTGRVVLSSSGPDEYSQESDKLHGSFFTHHLLAGMRGVADHNRDGKVTVAEAYEYAYEATVSSTFATQAGVQRPSYHMDLKGYGQLVLSDTQRSRGRLEIRVEAPGNWEVYDAAGGGLVGQFDKGSGAVVLALEPGNYRVRARSNGQLTEATLNIDLNETATLGEDRMHSEPVVVETTRKGPLIEGSQSPPRWQLLAGGTVGTASVPAVSTSFGARLRGGLLLDGGGAFNLISATAGAQRGQALGATRFRQDELDLRAGAGHAFNPGGRVSAQLGLELGGRLVRQSQLPGEAPRLSALPTAAVFGVAQVRLGGPVLLFLEVDAGGSMVPLEKRRFLPRYEGLLGLGIEL